MRSLTVRGLTIGEGRAKIIVPIVAQTCELALMQAERIQAMPADMIEWRADHLSGNLNDILSTLIELRKALSLPLLFTYRTMPEGGKGDISKEDYLSLNRLAAQSGADLIDIELFCGDADVQACICDIHASGAYALISSHNFQSTPPKEEILRTLLHMQALGADIPKVAYMPKTTEDVLALLSASAAFKRQSNVPFLAISMGALGAVSRIAGGTFGSALTFGAAEEISAPGQLPADTLSLILNALDISK